MKTAEQWADIFCTDLLPTSLRLKDLFRQAQAEAREAQHKATWALVVEAAKDGVRNKLGITSRALPILDALPCPPLETGK